MHQKAFGVNSVYAAVVTTNLDNRSFRLNFEITILDYAPRFIEDVATMLTEDVARSHRAATDEYTDKSFFFKLAVRSACLLAPIL
jgi:cardiolipin synthase